MGEELRWWRNRTGDHFPPHKFIQRTFEPRENYTKQLLITSRGHQEPRKAAHHLRKQAEQNIKDKETEQLGMEIHPGKGVLTEEVSKHQETLSPAGLGKVFKSWRAT